MRPGPTTRRGKFYDYLRKAGFLDSEATQFSKRPELKKTPYFQKLVNIRRANLLTVRKQHKQESGEKLNTDSKAYRAYSKRIKSIYEAKGYKQARGGKGQIVISPWALLKAFENEWKNADKNHDAYYDYVAPYDRKLRSFTEDKKILEKGYQKALFVSYND